MSDSLRVRLELWLVLPLAVVAGFDVWWTAEGSQDAARLVQERMLIGAARMIGEQVHVEDGLVQVDVPPAALELFVSPPYRDSVYYRVEPPSRRILAGHFDLKSPPQALSSEEVVYFQTEMRGATVHAVAFGQPVFESSFNGPVTIVVAQTLEGRKALARTIWLRAIVGHLSMLLLAAVLIWFGLERSLQPLNRLRQQLSDRKPGALEPLSEDRVVAELRPLVHVVNEYVTRLEAHVSAQERFISNAAHQLRTPLALLNTQAVYGRRSESAAELKGVLTAMDSGIQHAVRLVHQLLSLDMAQAHLGVQRDPVPVDLVKVTRAVLEELAVFSERRGMDLGFESALPSCIISADPVLMHELISNLVDNAIRYANDGGRVTVHVDATPQGIEWSVVDNGPGIPAQEKGKVFQRFYRMDNSRSDGSGLGLAIVQEIVDGCGASISLEDPVVGTGLVVKILLPRESTENGAQHAHPLKAN